MPSMPSIDRVREKMRNFKLFLLVIVGNNNMIDMCYDYHDYYYDFFPFKFLSVHVIKRQEFHPSI